MPVDSIPTDLACQCDDGAIYNVVREYTDPDHVTYEIMRWKYHSAADVLRNGLHVSRHSFQKPFNEIMLGNLTLEKLSKVNFQCY